MGPYLAKKCNKEFNELKFFSAIGTFSQRLVKRHNPWSTYLAIDWTDGEISDGFWLRYRVCLWNITKDSKFYHWMFENNFNVELIVCELCPNHMSTNDNLIRNL